MVTVVQAVNQTKRVVRRPSHTFHIRHRPWQIQPFMIAPVLAGETMKNLVMQSRTVTDPVINPLVGWWNEYYFFYVKHRDLDERDLLTSMMLDQTTDLSSLNTATSEHQYYVSSAVVNSINWVEMCTKRIVDEYFRFEGELAATYKIDGVYQAGIAVDNYLDSAINDADFTPTTDIDLTSTTAGVGDGTAAVTTSEIDQAMRMWEFQRHNNLTDMTYEDYLRQNGVNIPGSKELHKPELLRFVRDWSYPSNTVDPATGSPTSAVSWSTAERADKDRFFSEPGFIIGLAIARPKVYFRNIASAAVQLLNGPLEWLPAIMRDDPYTSLKKITGTDYPLDGNTDDYWIDLKDLFIYGDQFVNFSRASTDASLVSLPTAVLQKRYAALTDANSLFVDNLDASGLTRVRQDGVVNLNILGHQSDTTPSHIGT